LAALKKPEADFTQRAREARDRWSQARDGEGGVALQPQHEEVSLLCAAYKSKSLLPCISRSVATSRIFIRGRMALRSARLRTLIFVCLPGIRRMNSGGVYLNIGSVRDFAGSISQMRDAGAQPRSELSDTTANFDFIQSYRPLTNVVRRPTRRDGKRFRDGHHN
jgi:hypothetical protein